MSLPITLDNVRISLGRRRVLAGPSLELDVGEMVENLLARVGLIERGVRRNRS